MNPRVNVLEGIFYAKYSEFTILTNLVNSLNIAVQKFGISHFLCFKEMSLKASRLYLIKNTGGKYFVKYYCNLK